MIWQSQVGNRPDGLTGCDATPKVNRGGCDGQVDDPQGERAREMLAAFQACLKLVAKQMRRRNFLLLSGGSVLLPLGAPAQQSLPAIGFLFIGNPARSSYWTGPWDKAMREAGFVEGRNFAAEYRYGDGDPTKLPGFAAELVSRRV